MKKNYIAIFIIFIFSFNNSFAYNSDDLLNFYYQGTVSIEDIYIVPEGKDLLVKHVYTDNKTNAELYMYNDGQVLAGGGFDTAENPVNIVIKDLLQLSDGSSANNYIITGILVKEGVEIDHIVNGEDSGINAPIFDEETLIEIYQYEGLIMIFIIFYTFFMRLLGKLRKKRIFTI